MYICKSYICINNLLGVHASDSYYRQGAVLGAGPGWGGCDIDLYTVFAL